MSSSSDSEGAYYMIGMHIVLPYWQEHKRGLEAAAAELGVQTVFTGVSDNDGLRQVEIFNQAVKEHPAGIMVSPIDPDAMKVAIDAAVAQGIPVICIDSDSPDSDRLMFIGTNNYQSGWTAGEILGEDLGGSGDVGVLTIPGLYSMDMRQKGLEDCLAQNYPGMRVVAVECDNADPYDAVTASDKMFTENPEIRGLFCVNAAGGVGAAVTLKEKDLVGKVTVVAFDRDSDVLDLVEQGVIKATLVQRTFVMSYYAVKLLYDFNHRHLNLSADFEDVNPLPSSVDTGIIVVTQDNIKTFR